MTIADLVEDPSKTHHPCPFCPSSDAFTIEPKKGDTGVGKCFSCGAGCTGAQMYAHVMHVPIHEALKDMGVEGDYQAHRAARQHQKRRERLVPVMDGLSPKEKERARHEMNETEKHLLLTYAMNALHAMQEWHLLETDEGYSVGRKSTPDPHAFRYWKRKADDVYRVAFAREIDHHHVIDKIDSHYHPQATNADTKGTDTNEEDEQATDQRVSAASPAVAG